MAKSRLVPFRGLDVRLPDPTRLAGHNFVHHRVNDANRPSPVELRWLLDMALIMARHEAAIDRSELDRYCVQTGQGEVLATYLAFGETLLGRQSPALTARPDGDAMRKLRQYIDPVGAPARARRGCRVTQIFWRGRSTCCRPLLARAPAERIPAR